MEKVEKNFTHLLHLMKNGSTSSEVEFYRKIISGWIGCQLLVSEISSEQDTEFRSRLDEAYKKVLPIDG